MIARSKITTKQGKEKLRSLRDDMKSVPCADCKVSYPPYVMDFDHRPDEEKIGDIGNLITLNSKKLLLDEIAKCDVVCANCHRERTHQRRTLKFE